MCFHAAAVGGGTTTKKHTRDGNDRPFQRRQNNGDTKAKLPTTNVFFFLLLLFSSHSLSLSLIIEMQGKNLLAFIFSSRMENYRLPAQSAADSRQSLINVWENGLFPPPFCVSFLLLAMAKSLAGGDTTEDTAEAAPAAPPGLPARLFRKAFCRSSICIGANIFSLNTPPSLNSFVTFFNRMMVNN